MTLAAVPLELAGEHEAVKARLTRLQLADRPDKLAAGFRKTLNGRRRSKRFLVGDDAREFGRTLEAWLDQVAGEVMPKAAPTALELFESFIKADAVLFDCADDSNGAVGDAVRSAGRRWLQAASQCEAQETEWPSRVIELVAADAHGPRDELLGRSDLLFDETGLRGLVSRFESGMTQALADAASADRPSSAVFRASASLSLLSQALHDPNVKVRAVQRYSPEPNAVQRMDFARAYVDVDRPADAVPWLQEPWGQHEGSRYALLAQALKHLPRYCSNSRKTMRRRCARRIQSHPRRRLRLAGALGQDLARTQLWRAETAVCRALLTSILDRAYARAYGHGARYWNGCKR